MGSIKKIKKKNKSKKKKNGEKESYGNERWGRKLLAETFRGNPFSFLKLEVGFSIFEFLTLLI